MLSFWGALLAFAIFSWDKASGLSVRRRKRLAFLKAIGGNRRCACHEILGGDGHFSVVVLAGILVAYVHVFFTSSVLFEPALKGWAILYPRFKLIPFVNPYQVITLFF